MPVTHLHPTSEVYLQFKLLSPASQPCLVVREDGATLLTIDPRSRRGEVSSWVVEHLTRTEQNAYRAAYGQPPVDQPLDDRLFSDDPVILHIPESLRLHLPARLLTELLPGADARQAV